VNEELARILETSDDPKELIQAAVQLARSDQRADQEALLKSLGAMAFLNKLNTEAEYNGAPGGLRVARVLEDLRKNKAPVARDTILALSRNQTFRAAGSRVELLIGATVVIRPAPPELVEFWDKYCQPEDGYGSLTVAALLENGSKPALELFEKKMLDAAHPEDDKRVWLRFFLVPLRNQTGVLQSCRTLLEGPLADPLKSELVDVLFDYKPEVWYTPAVNFDAPPLANYSATARTEMRAIGQYVIRDLTLTDRQRKAVQEMLDRLERRGAEGAGEKK